MSKVDITKKSDYQQVGLIQSHCCLIVVWEDNHEIVALSQNATSFFGVVGPEKFVGKHLSALLGQERASSIIHYFPHDDFNELNPLQLQGLGTMGEMPLDVILHRDHRLIFVEVEKVAPMGNQAASPYKILKSTVQRMHQATNLSELCKITAREVRKITGHDRVMICRFDMHMNWSIVASDQQEGVQSFDDFLFPYTDMSFEQVENYAQSRTRFIPDVNAEPEAILGRTQKPIPAKLNFLHAHHIPNEDIRFLKDMGVSSAFTLPILKNNQLWGLIMCHNLEQYYPGYETRSATELVSDILSAQIVLREEAESRDYSSEKGKKLNELIEATSSRGTFL